MAKTPKITTKMTTPAFTAGWCNLFKPNDGTLFSPNNPQPKYSVEVMIPKNNDDGTPNAENHAWVESVKKECEAIAEKAHWSTPTPDKFPIKDGDAIGEDGNTVRGGDYKGFWWINMNKHADMGRIVSVTKTPEGVVELKEQHDMPSKGDTIKVSFKLKYYNSAGNKGVTTMPLSVFLVAKGTADLQEAKREWEDEDAVDIEDMDSPSSTATEGGESAGSDEFDDDVPF